MAEIQWVVEVRCVNTLLANFKVGERGQHICVHAPDRQLDPHEFGKLIEGAQATARIAAEHRSARGQRPVSPDAAPIDAELGTEREVLGRRDLYEIQFLQSGEIVLVDIPGAVMGPAEFDQFIAELKSIQTRLAPFA